VCIASWTQPERESKHKAHSGDDIYEAMLSGVDRNQFLSMMTLWSVGQGIGVRVRCWIENRPSSPSQEFFFGKEVR